MAALRTFQNEIDEVVKRSLAKAIAEKAAKEREATKDAKEARKLPVKVDKASKPEKEKAEKAAVESSAAANTVVEQVEPDSKRELSETEDNIQVSAVTKCPIICDSLFGSHAHEGVASEGRYRSGTGPIRSAFDAM